MEFKSNRKYYWWSLYALIFLVINFNFFFVKDFKNFSFEFYFLMMIPVWIGSLSLNGYETTRIKNFLREYLMLNYPDKLNEFDQKPVDILDSETEDILDLFKDPMLQNNPVIVILKKESDDVTRFMYAVFFALPLMLVFSVFVVLKW